MDVLKRGSSFAASSWRARVSRTAGAYNPLPMDGTSAELATSEADAAVPDMYPDPETYLRCPQASSGSSMPKRRDNEQPRTG